MTDTDHLELQNRCHQLEERVTELERLSRKRSLLVDCLKTMCRAVRRKDMEAATVALAEFDRIGKKIFEDQNK